MSHTKGPWRVSEEEPLYSDEQYAITRDVVSIEGERVCVVLGADEDWLDRDQNTALLIAAAPDLLEALKALYEHCSMVHKHWGDNCNQREADLAIAAGHAAIAKAEGRS